MPIGLWQLQRMKNSWWRQIVSFAGYHELSFKTLDTFCTWNSDGKIIFVSAVRISPKSQLLIDIKTSQCVKRYQNKYHIIWNVCHCHLHSAPIWLHFRFDWIGFRRNHCNYQWSLGKLNVPSNTSGLDKGDHNQTSILESVVCHSCQSHEITQECWDYRFRNMYMSFHQAIMKGLIYQKCEIAGDTNI